MSKVPERPLTKSGIEAEMNRIHREFIYDALQKGKNLDRLLEEMKQLVEHVKKNKTKISDE